MCGAADKYTENKTKQGELCKAKKPCTCLESNGLPTVKCSKSYAKGGKCTNATLLGGALYPADYGVGCKSHAEPGDSKCYNLSTGKPLPKDKAAAYCDLSWCYVDPCKCDLSDVAGGNSTYFAGYKAFYSYSMCGATDKYTENKTKQGELCKPGLSLGLSNKASLSMGHELTGHTFGTGLSSHLGVGMAALAVVAAVGLVTAATRTYRRARQGRRDRSTPLVFEHLMSSEETADKKDGV